MNNNINENMDYIIQLNFYNYLDYKDYRNLLQTNKKYYYNSNYNNDLIYKYYLLNKFSDKFIEMAKSIIISYYDCLVRIETFENTLKNLGYELWKEDVYFMYWKAKNMQELKDSNYPEERFPF